MTGPTVLQHNILVALEVFSQIHKKVSDYKIHVT